MNARDWPEQVAAPADAPTAGKGESWRIAN